MSRLEKLIRDALADAGLRFVCEGHGETRALDFYLPDDDLYIEVKQFHSERIAGQMARADNVIAVQGAKTVDFFVRCLNGDLKG